MQVAKQEEMVVQVATIPEINLKYTAETAAGIDFKITFSSACGRIQVQRGYINDIGYEKIHFGLTCETKDLQWEDIVSNGFSACSGGTITENWTEPGTYVYRAKLNFNAGKNSGCNDCKTFKGNRFQCFMVTVNLAELPTLTTTEVTSITGTTATSGGNITEDGGCSITARGICWNTLPNPIVADSHTDNGGGTGSFTSPLTGLAPNTVYHVRAYATNCTGTNYGNQESFTTRCATPVGIPVFTLGLTSTRSPRAGNVRYTATATNSTGITYILDDASIAGGNSINTVTREVTYVETWNGISIITASAAGCNGPTTATHTATTSSGPELGTFTDERDGNTYDWIRLGDQIWMAENLAYLPSVIPLNGWGTLNSYWVYGYSGTDVSAAKATAAYGTYGVLYGWSTAKNACPSGWHLPSSDEATHLVNYLIAHGYNYDGTTIDNKIAKSMAAKTNWGPSSVIGTPGNDPTNNNETGFSLLPGGVVDPYFGRSTDEGDESFYWTSTEYPDLINNRKGAYDMRINFDIIYVIRTANYEIDGESVRCVKD